MELLDDGLAVIHILDVLWWSCGLCLELANSWFPVQRDYSTGSFSITQVRPTGDLQLSEYKMVLRQPVEHAS